MGLELQRLLCSKSLGKLKQLVVSPGSKNLGCSASGGQFYEAPGPLDPSVEAAIDFSSPEGLLGLLREAQTAGIPVVSGTTGLQEQHRQALVEAALTIPVCWASNFSLGMLAVHRGVRLFKRLLKGFDIELVECHHGAKKDAPSGTALSLLSSLDAEELEFGRHGNRRRRPGEVGVHSLRGGSNPGSHSIHFLGAGEDIVLTHQCWSREVFARGAIATVNTLLRKKAGLYEMADLFTSDSPLFL